VELVPFHDTLLPQLTALVNEHLRIVPPGWTLNEAQLAFIIQQPNAVWTAHYPQDAENVTVQTMCVVDSTQLVAAASWFMSDDNEEFPRISVLSWLVGRSDRALDSLLSEFARQSAAHHSASIEICPRNGLGVGWFGIPDVWPHLKRALERLGCVPKDPWVMMHIPIELITQSVPDLPGFSFNWNIKEPQLEWELTAQTQETLAGECFAWGIPTHFRENANFDEWITFEWVGVEEPYRRRGLARRLMLEQMLFHYQRGVRNVMLWVEVDNLPARSLYESLGFLYGPECATFELHLFEDHDGQTESI
jgi:GNAT superfamily N-acetyltransferase